MTPADQLALFFNETIAEIMTMDEAQQIDAHDFEILLRGYVLGLRAALKLTEPEGEIPF